MDQEEGDEEVKQEVKLEEPKHYKVLLNNMNSWFSSFIIEKLRTDLTPEARTTYEFMGTRQKTKNLLPRLFEPKEISIDFNYNYENEVFTNDIFIYNMEDADFKEVDYVIKGLKALKYETEKVLIIVTSIMTWVRTTPKYRKENEEEDQDQNAEGNEEQQQPEGEKEPESEDEEYVPEEEPEEEKEEEHQKEEVKEGEDEEGKEPEVPKKILYFKEKDYIKRIPSERYYQHKMTETLAISNTNPMLKTYIVCAGFIYGCGENMFYDYFKMAWLQQPKKLPLILKGKNTIPTIHIQDLVSLLKRIIEQRPNMKYIFAIDHTKNRTLKNIITSISKGVGTGLIESLDETKKDQIPFFEELSIDIKARPTKLFLDEKRDDEEEEEFEKRTFKWHCEMGIPENQDKLRKEFNEYRNLKNVKIAITGPPASGKTKIAKKISKFFNILHLKIEEIVEWGKQLTDELGEEIKAKQEEIETSVKEAEENYIKRPNKKKTDLPLDTSQMKKFPEEIIIKLLRRKLSENICLNRGYVLDGYPKGYKNAFALFMEDTDDSKPPEDETKYKIMTDILPNSVIRIDHCSDEFLKDRLQKLEDVKKDPTLLERRMERRLELYKALNESKKGEPNLTNFYIENKVEVIVIDGTLKKNRIFDQAKVFIERNGAILNYQIFDHVKEKEEKKDIVQVIGKEVVKVDQEVKENEFFDIEKAEVKERYNKERINNIKEKERKLLEEKSEVLRRYLAENVIPVLSKGILHVCQAIPEDPVDALANYLLDNAFNAKFPPHKYKDS